MKRFLIIMLITILLAGYLGTLIARDPGYVLITYGDYSLQTSLWILLGLLFTFSLLVYVLLRSFGIVGRTRGVYQNWWSARKISKASDLTQRGLTLLAEGEFERARKFLENGADNSNIRGLNYLSAARAANDTGDSQAREKYLRLATETDPGLTRAGAIVAAELALDRHEPDAALTLLTGVRQNRHVARLKMRALREAANWRDMIAALPEIRKVNSGDALALERTAARLAFSSEHHNDSALIEVFKGLSAELKKEPAILTGYANALKKKSHAESLLRSAIKRSWQADLLTCYGASDADSLKIRRKTAEGWLKKHPDDAALQFCLGSLYEFAGETSLAIDAFTKASELGSDARANEHLALLLAKSGEFERSTQQMKIALSES